MLGSLVRRFWLLPLVALAFTGLACEKKTVAQIKELSSSPFAIAPGTHKDFQIEITAEMVEVPREENNITLYARWTNPSEDTVSVYVMGDIDYSSFIHGQPFVPIREYHGVTGADFWIHDMWLGDYHLVLDNHNPSPVNMTNVSIRILYFAYVI
jgi:hypothetical protein